MLTAYDGISISYDAIGNPTNDANWSYTWTQGRQLSSMYRASVTWNFTYDANGMRTGRSYGSTAYTYVYNGSQLSHMTYGSNTMKFTYGADGSPLAINYNGTTYYYVVNLQGDVVAILDSSGAQVVGYTYDAWGRLLSTTGSKASSLGLHNPLRYRGYVYDRETGLYYLQSRYYNPTIGRFINADGEIPGVAGNLPSNNMFLYSTNNPVNLGYQSNGYSIKTLATIFPTLGSTTGNSTTTLNPVISNAPAFSVINYVNKVHITTPTAMLDLGFWFGRIGFSSTFTTQDKELGLFHCYSDLGNDANKYGVGINLGGWLGVGAGVSDELHLFVNAQVSPWLHGEISAGLDGIGASIGVDVGDMSYDFEIKCGAGVLIMIVAPQLFGSYLPQYNLAPR